MFGASVLVPILFNSVAKTTVVDPSLVLMMNGVGTLIYLFICRGKDQPSGSRVAFLSPTFAVIAAAGANRNLASGIRPAASSCGPDLRHRFADHPLGGPQWLNVVLPPAAMGWIFVLIGLELAVVATSMSFYPGNDVHNGGPDVAGASGVATAISLFTLAIGSSVR